MSTDFIPGCELARLGELRSGNESTGKRKNNRRFSVISVRLVRGKNTLSNIGSSKLRSENLRSKQVRKPRV